MSLRSSEVKNRIEIPVLEEFPSEIPKGKFRLYERNSAFRLLNLCTRQITEGMNHE